MTNYELLNLVSSGKDIRKKKLNFKKNFTRIDDIFVKNVRFIEEINSEGFKISDSSSWLLDNFVTIENEVIKLFNDNQINVKEFVSVKFDREFFPRIYLFCSCVVENESGIFDSREFFEKLSEYEKNVKLNLKEIKSVPFFLKYAVLEKIYKLVNEACEIEKQKYNVNVFLNNIVNLLEDGKSSNALKKFEKFLGNNISMHSIQCLIDLVNEKEIKDKLINDILDEFLKEKEIIYKDLKILNNRELNDNRIKLSMWIQSLKNISLFNWKIELENVSSVHKEFLKDPAGVYPNMDYESREFYRNTFEKICAKNNSNEYIECLKILNFSSKGKDNYSRHIGYYLISEGSKKIKGRNLSSKFRTSLYFLSIAIGIIFLEFILLKYTRGILHNKFIFLGMGLVFLILVSDLWINMINYLFFRNIKSRFIPKMDYSKKIPNDAKTIVGVSSVLTNKKDIDDLFKNLELSYICNKGENLYFSILFDYVDTLSYEGFEDKVLLGYARDKLECLNKKYGSTNENKFYMFVRNKIYSDSNKVYMGWERKRGKIMEFIKFLKGRENNFNENLDDYCAFKDMRYMIILDSNTRLMKDSAFKLIGAINHILNRGVVKNIRNKNKVVRGYGIIQPRVKINFKSSLRTIYSKLFTGDATEASFNLLSSKVYQDVFSDSLFIGKGIIDIDIFDKVLWNVIPEDRVLSHNLIEGCFSRVLFCPDIEIEEKFSSNILYSFLKLHRCVRGDWQLISYLFKGRGINLISKYKILDNLRKSLVPIACFILLFFMNMNLSGKYVEFILIGLLFSLILNMSYFTFVHRGEVCYKFENLKDKAICTYVMIAFLPYYTYIVLDGVIRSLLRLFITKKNLLEWRSFQTDERLDDLNYLYFKRMAVCIVFGILCLVFSFNFRNYFMFLLSFVFISSPFIAKYLSKKYEIKNFKVNYDQNIFLRSLFRNTFSYFEDFLNESTNYLICDSYQEDNSKGISNKTSPTSIGMSLNSIILARDFGFITIIDMVDKLNRIIDSIDSLPVYRGHLYSCYDIKDTVPIGDRYISTVESGNLLASYYFCRKSLEDILKNPIIHTDLVKSFEDMSYLSSNYNYDHLYKDYIENGYNSSTFTDYIKFLSDMLESSVKNIRDLEKENSDVYWHIKINESANKFLDEIFNLTCKISEISSFKVNKFGEIFITKSIGDLERELLEFKKNYNNSSVRNEVIDLKISEIISNVKDIVLKIYSLIDKINFKIYSMDFKFLYNGDKKLLSKGYDCESDLLDENYHDLFASESRISSFLSIAKGDIPLEHWYNLDRFGVECGKNKVLFSQYGSVSEYFMPMLYMKSYPKTLLSETYRGYFNLQVKYTNHNRLPLGISEFFYYDFDNKFNSKVLGISDLSIIKNYKNLVISPYSTLLTSMINFKRSIKNLKKLKKMGCIGKYGFYESINFMNCRMYNRYQIVKGYSAYHHGMSLMSLANILIDDVCQSRFENITEVESIYELLNESCQNILINNQISIQKIKFNIGELYNEYTPRIINHNKNEFSEMQVYSNGEYSIGISSSGGGYLKFRNQYISKLGFDAINERVYGSIYIRDIDLGEFFSDTYLPCKNDSVNYTCEFDLNKVTFKANKREINVLSEIIVSNDDNVEIRKVVLKNMTSKIKNLELTSYFESDILNKNFDFESDNVICICSDDDSNLFMGHSVYFNSNLIKEIKFENSKQGFLGLNGSLQYPICMGVNSNYGNIKFDDSMIMSLRLNIRLTSYEHVSLYYINAIDSDKEKLCKTINKYKNINLLSSLYYENLYNFKIMINNLKITTKELYLFNYMTCKIVYGVYNESYKLGSNINIRDLVSHNIKYNVPMVSVELKNNEDLKNIEILIKAFSYFIRLNFSFNLIILNSYLRFDKVIDNEINRIISKYNLNDRINIDGGIYIILSNIYKNTYDVIKNLSNIFIESGNRSVYDQLKFNISDFSKANTKISNLPILVNENIVRKNLMVKYLFEVGNEIFSYNDVNRYIMPKKILKFYNSYGGFSKNYSEYITKINSFNVIPYTYKNILGNGFIYTCVLSNGFMNTWAFKCKDFLITEGYLENSYNMHGECIYIREDDCVWSPTFNPIDNGEDYIVSNSIFSTKITNKYNNINTTFECYVPEGKKYKVIKMEFKNLSSNLKNLNIYYFAPIVLSSMDDYSKKLSIYIDREFDYIYGENNFSKNFKNIKSYLKIFGCVDVSFTGSKKEFLGINGSYFNPVGVYKENLSNLTGMYLDSCLCTSGKIILEPFDTKKIYIILGFDDNIDGINLELSKLSDNLNLFDELYEVNKSSYLDKNKTFQIRTSDEHLDIIFNQWILYQNNNEKFFINHSFRGNFDSCVNLMEKCFVHTYVNPELSKKIIIKVFSNMNEDGSFKDKWSSLINEYQINKDMYDLLWIVYILVDYTIITDDFDIFNIEINYINANCDSKIRFSNIYEKCLKIIGNCVYLDDLNNTIINKEIFEVKTLFMLYMVMDKFDLIFDKFNDYKNRDLFGKLKYYILSKLENECFNGEFFINNLKDINSESFYNDVFLLPQVLALFSIKNSSICEKIIVSIDKYLFNRESGFINETFIKNNRKHNQTKHLQNNRNLILLVKAISDLKLNDKSYMYLNFLNPILMTINRNFANLYKHEPYIIPSKIEFKDNSFYRILNEDFNHVSSLFYRIVLENILGFKLFKDGFYIDPCIPNSWNQYVIEYRRNDSFYKIIVRRGEFKKITINGEKHVEKLIKFMDNGEYVVDIVI